jgi:hypothetical protein
LKFLESGFRPVSTEKTTTFSDIVSKAIAESSEIEILTGYFGHESVVEFQAILEQNVFHRRVSFIVGMAAFDGLTETQIKSLGNLNDFLISKDYGGVLISVAFPIHSKVAVFSLSNGKTAAVIGSSNFTNLVSNDRQYETDLLITEEDSVLTNLEEFVERAKRACLPLREAENRISILAPKLSALSTEEGVKRIGADEDKIELSSVFFDIPIKPEAKSHLNVFFGKGRVNQQKVVMPRPWYEAEIIVPKEITTRKGYPSKQTSSDEFRVITDDGWSFSCNVTGTGGKNFRSAGNLEILGKWLKGRLEESGSLVPGERVTENTFREYGRDSMRLTKVAGNKDLWHLDFSRPRNEPK